MVVRQYFLDATLLDYADSSFDRILSTFMMRYLSESHQKVAIAEMLRTIKDRGRIDLIDFDIVPNYLRLQSSLFTPMRMKMMFENPFFEDVLREHGAAVSVVMDEVTRSKHPFPARLYHLQLAVRKGNAFNP